MHLQFLLVLLGKTKILLESRWSVISLVKGVSSDMRDDLLHRVLNDSRNEKIKMHIIIFCMLPSLFYRVLHYRLLCLKIRYYIEIVHSME